MTTETKPMKVESDGREIKKVSLLQALMVPLGLLLMGCGPVYFFYGFNFFLPLEWKLLNKTSEDWNRILEDKSMLMLGGHHRGGTTLMWNMLKLHPSIGSFGTMRETGADYSEGVFLQDVIPLFGIGSEGLGGSTTGNRRSEDRGLGMYALAPENEVHWTEDNHKDQVTYEKRDRLLNAWGYHWLSNKAMDKPYLMEKSPTNAVVSRYLQAVFDLGIENEQRRRRGSTRSKFLFLVRHPIANSYAHRAGFAGCQHLGMDKLIGNWLKIMTYIQNDAKKKQLRQVMIVRLEDLTANPDKVYREVLKYLELDVTEEVVQRAVSIVKPNQNAKYELQFCKDIYKHGYQVGNKAFEELDGMFGSEVRALGYDLREYMQKCPQPGSLKAGESSGEL